VSAMTDPASVRGTRPISIATLWLAGTLVTAIYAVWGLIQAYLGSDGYLSVPNQPFGADFINVWTTGRLVVSDVIDTIYRHQDFMAYQQTFMNEDIGLRMWANPPHSLLFVWPFGLTGHYAAFVLWSVLGLALLGFGARRFGFTWTETAILVFSPAAMRCIAGGQTGNLACGLLLAALAGASLRSRSSIVAAAILTVKPQIGFLLPLLWIVRGKWALIAATGLLTVCLVLLSVFLFGAQAWRDYLGDTLPALADLEKRGQGPFMLMIPSMFMSMRLAGLGADAASAVHFAFAGAVMVFLIWRLSREANATRQVALVLIGTCLVTPYLHIYDLGILLAGALLVLRGVDALQGWVRAVIILAAGLAWALPELVMQLGNHGVPISPLIILAILLVACLPQACREDVAIGNR
jgi:hypothetical protein